MVVQSEWSMMCLMEESCMLRVGKWSILIKNGLLRLSVWPRNLDFSPENSNEPLKDFKLMNDIDLEFRKNHSWCRVENEFKRLILRLM